MPGLILFLSCTGLCAWRITTVLASREPEALTRIERGVWIGVMGFGIWLAQGHLLSLFGRFEPNALVITSLATLASVLLGSRRLLPIAPTRQVIAERIARSRFSLHHPIALDTVLPFALVTAVVIYSVAALLVLPVSNHDALAYHFPKAMELVTTRAFGLYPSQDWRIPYSPGNYELLVATILTFLHADWATGLITSGALLLFLTTSFTLFKRAWQDTRSAILAAAMMLASPVFLSTHYRPQERHPDGGVYAQCPALARPLRSRRSERFCHHRHRRDRAGRRHQVPWSVCSARGVDSVVACMARRFLASDANAGGASIHRDRIDLSVARQRAIHRERRRHRSVHWHRQQSHSQCVEHHRVSGLLASAAICLDVSDGATTE